MRAECAPRTGRSGCTHISSRHDGGGRQARAGGVQVAATDTLCGSDESFRVPLVRATGPRWYMRLHLAISSSMRMGCLNCSHRPGYGMSTDGSRHLSHAGVEMVGSWMGF